MRTIDEFRATKRWSEDLGEAIGCDTGRGKIAGWIYADTLYIEDTATWTWPADKPPPRGKFYLLLDRSEWLSDTIEPLETRLFAYWLSEHPEAFAPIAREAVSVATLYVARALGVADGATKREHFREGGRPMTEFAEVMAEYLVAEAMR